MTPTPQPPSPAIDEKALREAFEHWISTFKNPDWRSYIERNTDGSYKMLVTIGAWCAWQKAVQLYSTHAPAPSVVRVERCVICDWPLAESVDKGCVKGNCSYRPEYGSPEYQRIQKRKADITASSIEREKVASWMIRNGFATGHGDTTEDLLAELEEQIDERRVVPSVQKFRELISLASMELLDMIDGGEECRARDSQISHVIGILEGDPNHLLKARKEHYGK